MSATTAHSTMISTTTTTTIASAATATSTTCAVNYEIPTSDAACAAVSNDKTGEIMKKCCGEASVVSINGGCASYCLAQGQDIGSLSACLYGNGLTGNSVYCNESNKTASATAAVTSGSATTTTGSTGTSASTSSATATGAAVPAAKVSTTGVGVLALLFCSALFGVMA